MPISREISEYSVRQAREKVRRRCRESLLTWCEAALSVYGQEPQPHHRLLIRELEDIEAGRNDRLMVFMPPGSAKSTYASVLFPPWFLARRANRDVIGASHGADLAEDFSGRVVRTIKEHPGELGYGLLTESQKLWRTSNGGVYRAAGAGGSITGRRADLFVIDDPIKGREDADSEVIREKVWAWYRAEVITRLKPGARIVLIQTRWHESDLGGRLLEEMAAGADQWRVISLPAIAEAEDDPLGRAIGDPLWPEWEDLPALERKRMAVGAREWAALYQQRPAPLEGSLFKVGQIGVMDTAPAGGIIARAWDLAATAQVGSRDPDWTAGVKLARLNDGRLVVLDVVRLRGGPDEVESTIVNTAAQDRHGVRVGLPQDPGQAGKQQVLYFTRRLMGFTIDSSPETGDKATRAAPVASQVNVGNLHIVKAPWNRAFLDELAAFPSGSHDDQVDALSRAFSMVGLSAPMNISPQAMALAGARR
jgi:predicted phage terminase large subunit-like protein